MGFGFDLYLVLIRLSKTECVTGRLNINGNGGSWTGTCTHGPTFRYLDKC